MCQFHWELDCVGFSPFEIWRCGCAAAVAAAYLPTTELRAPQGVALVSLVGRFTLTVVNLRPIALFNKIIQHNLYNDCIDAASTI